MVVVLLLLVFLVCLGVGRRLRCCGGHVRVGGRGAGGESGGRAECSNHWIPIESVRAGWSNLWSSEGQPLL